MTAEVDGLIERLEDACCCEPDQGFVHCGACVDLEIVERLQRELQEQQRVVEGLQALLGEAYQYMAQSVYAGPSDLFVRVSAALAPAENHRCRACGNYDCNEHP